MNKQNTPWKVTDQDGQEMIVWESRSTATAVFVYTKDNQGHYRILAVKRGKGCPNHIGEWCCPCGYLDYNETLKDAACRECFEETGSTLGKNQLTLFKITDDPNEENQNLSEIFYGEIDDGLNVSFSNKYSEPNEVDEIFWIRLDLLDNFNWAFGHKELIMDIWSRRIFIPWWKKILLKLSEKYL